MSQTENSVIIWNINGHQYEMDLQDVDVTKRYEEAFRIMGEEEKALPKDGASSDRLLATCMMFRHLFDNLLGKGAADEIFGKKNNARVMFEVYEDFLGFVQGQQVGMAETQNRIITRFSPNRAQRREAAKQAKKQ